MKRMTYWKKFLFATIATVIALGFVTATAYAADNDLSFSELSGKRTLVFTINESRTLRTSQAGQIQAAISSNGKVISASRNDKTLTLTARKIGKATVYYIYKGKRYGVNVQVVKYQIPVAKVLIGSKNITPMFRSGHSTASGRNGINTKNQTVKVTPAKGWKLLGIRYTYHELRGHKYTNRIRTIRNGGRVAAVVDALHNTEPDVLITLKNTSNGSVVQLRVNGRSRFFL